MELPGDRKLSIFNVHYSASPYQPYQLLNIPYGDAPFISSEQEAIEWAHKSRGKQVDQLLRELLPSLRAGEICVVTGDFNEPSSLDWTERSKLNGRHPLKVEYPATKRLLSVNMRDAWREVHPDEISAPGFTWTPTTKEADPTDHHDRIDFVFVDANSCQVENCELVGEKDGADIEIAPWPSDHRAVVATIRIQNPAKAGRL